MEPVDLGQAQDNSKPAKTISVSRRVQNAIRECQGSKGVSIPDLKKHLRDSKKLDLAVHGPEINLALKNGVDRGILTKESGLYKVNTSAGRRRRKSPSKRRKTSRRRKSGSRRRKSPKRRKSRSRRRKSPKRKGSRKRHSRRRKKTVEPEE